MGQTRDIEDVLSSIRRLVANDATAVPAEVDSAAPALLLDATQRVTEPEDPFQTIRELSAEDIESRGTGPAGEKTARTGNSGGEPASPGAFVKPFDRNADAAPASTFEDIPVEYLEDDDYEAPREVEPDAEPGGPDDRASETVGPPPEAIDRDELRKLVADVVRQELAGELGERITRNVRKLVRREIRQMLASDEFD